MHQALHVLILLFFLGALAMAFLGLAAPLVFQDRGGGRLPAFRTSVLLAGAAGAVLAADWLGHNLL